MDAGSSARNTRRNIDITSLADILGPLVCSALPAFHIFTGSDYTAGFMRKGKLRPYDLMTKSEHFLNAFSKIGCSNVVDPEVYSVLEKFVCSMYGQTKCHEVNVARFAIFTKMYASKNEEKALKTIKSSDPCCIPPCSKVLLQKVNRCNYVTLLYKNATLPTPINFSPEGHGWVIDKDGQLRILWYDGPKYPSVFKQNMIIDSESDDDEDQAYASSSGDETDDTLWC